MDYKKNYAIVLAGGKGSRISTTLSPEGKISKTPAVKGVQRKNSFSRRTE